MRAFLHWMSQTRPAQRAKRIRLWIAQRKPVSWLARHKILELIPLLVAVLALQLIFRFGLPYLWWAGHSFFHWWPGISSFWEQDNQIDIMQQISINAIMAFGMTLTILIGGIDLSVGAVQALVGTITVTILVGSFLLVTSILTVIGTLLSDILLAWVDPRIRFGGAGEEA